jgi:hypothetical protein
MSRSVKKRLFGSYYTCESDKKYKQIANRRERHRIKQLLVMEQTDEGLPDKKQFGDSEDFGKGKKKYLPYLHHSGWDFSFMELLRRVRK